MMNRWITTSLLFVAAAITAQAQQATPDKNAAPQIRVHVEKERSGSTQVFDRTFANQASADRFLDSLNKIPADRSRVTVNSGTNTNNNTNPRANLRNFRLQAPNAPNAPNAPRSPQGPPPPPQPPRLNGDGTAQLDRRNFDRDMNQFGRDMERWSRDLADRSRDAARRVEQQFRQNFRPEDFRFNFDGRGPNGSANGNNGGSRGPLGPLFDINSNASSRTVKALNAYPNQPFNGQLNVTFQTPEKGDVLITVTDVTGKQVASEKIKDVSGRYVGQIDLKRNSAKGTYFLTVSQGNDGAVKRIVIE